MIGIRGLPHKSISPAPARTLDSGMRAWYWVIMKYVVALLSLLLPLAAFADTPLPAPKIIEVWARNRGFCAVMDPKTTTTVVYRVDGAGGRTRVWQMHAWSRVAALADDGEHLVVGYSGSGLVPLDFTMEEVMIWFYDRGTLIRKVLLKEMVPDRSLLQRTASHYYWGAYLGLDDQGRYVIKTVDGNTFRFDVRTGANASDAAQ
jgi:hypothetical protein